MFTEVTDYIIIPGTPIVDLTILPLPNGEYIWFIKNETALRIWSKRSSGRALRHLEKDRRWVEGRIHLWLDEYSGDTQVYGYVPQYTDDRGVTWVNRDRANFPALMKHGIVVPVNRTLYDAIEAKWAELRL
ncbi:hypothetical protein EDD18DRAFT_1357493 [Armillaria luteobubalina]|uniref:Uncharacterized protein n=1 Tax=Armillaria luteobubalina TaxID=153913 RepID=A0AA39PXZ4_9AGAR|nr:hypothetical protein EDD18DRAFT_1357493 [Armillaria luteobubalina]